MMKKQIRIKKRVIFAMLFAVLISVLLVSCDKTQEPVTEDTPSFSVTASETGVIYTTEKTEEPTTVVTEISDETVSVTNHFDVSCDYNIVCLKDGKTTEHKLTLNPGETGSFDVEKSSLHLIRVEFEKDGKKSCTGYPFDSDSLDDMLSSGGSENTVVIPVDINKERIDISRPVVINIAEGSITADLIYCKTEKEGKLTIKENNEDSFNVENFFAEAEKLTVNIPTIKKINSNISYYLRVYAYNGRIIDYTSINVTSYDEFSSLIDGEKLPTLYPSTKLTVSGNFTIPDELTFDFPISMSFKDRIVLENTIKITTGEKSELSFSADTTVTLPDYPFDIDAPDCAISWKIQCNSGISMIDVISHLHVLTVNGIAPSGYVLGGDGNAELTSISLLRSKNDNITEDIRWTLSGDGYILKATVDCVVDSKTLENAVLDLTVTNGGVAAFDKTTLGENGTVNLLSDSGCYVSVVDKSGKETRYLIETYYNPTPIPVVVIYTDSGEKIDVENNVYVPATFYMNNDGCTYYPEISLSAIQIRGRGHSSLKWEKTPYKIKFDKKTPVFGLTANKEWTMLANYSDKSLIRNTVAMEAAKTLSGLEYTPSQYPVDVFFNGEYVGVYTMGEQLEAKNGRLELTDNGSELDTGYMLEIGGSDSGDVWDVTCFYTTLCKYVGIKAPDDETLTKEQVAYIKDYVKKADEAVMNGVGYEEYIDMDALIDWVIIHELCYNIDCCFRRSCYFYKDAGGKLTMGPIWDFDNAFGNFWKDDKTYSTWATADTTSEYIWDNWMTYLINYADFREMFKARWEETKYSLLSTMLATIDTNAELISRSAEYNFETWDILDKRVGCEDSSIKAYNTFEKQIEYFKSFINARWKWLDENI